MTLYWWLGFQVEDEDSDATQWQQELLLVIASGSGQEAAKSLLSSKSCIVACRQASKADTAEGLKKSLGRKLSPAWLNAMPWGLPLITSPSDHISEFLFKDAVVVPSKASPIIIPCRCTSGYVRKVMYKKDELHRDALVMGAIETIQILLQNAGIEAPLTPYAIVPTSTWDGCIEIVDGSQTLYDIQQEGTLLDKLKQCACKSQSPLYDVQDGFITRTRTRTTNPTLTLILTVH